MLVQCTCLTCGKTFTVKPYRAANSKFCSRRCHYASKQVTLVCEQCGISFTEPAHRSERAHYCSWACRWAHGTTHGEGRDGRESPEHVSWHAVKDRCLNPAGDNWVNYGGRGITVCERWLTFENFLADMGRRPGPGYSINRLDNNLGYSPENCTWSTQHEQNRNRRNTRLVTFQGETLCIADWADRFGLPRDCLYDRLSAGWDIERALTTVPRPRR